jgi:hypothetical protein
MIKPIMQIKMNEELKRKYNTKLLDKTALNKRRGGRKKIDPELLKENQRAAAKKHKQGKRIWQAYTTDELMEKSDKLMKHLHFRNKHELLEWFMERAGRYFGKGGRLKLEAKGDED